MLKRQLECHGACWLSFVLIVAALAIVLPSVSLSQTLANYISTGDSYARSVAVNPVTNFVYVANYNSNDVNVFDGSTLSYSTFSTGTNSNPIFVAVNTMTNKVYVANYGSGTVTVIDAGNNNNLTTVTVGSNPVAIAIDEVTNKIYVANFGSGNVSVIDGTDNGVTNVPVGLETGAQPEPQSLAVNPVTHKVYVANSGSNNLTIIDGNNTTTIALGSSVNLQEMAIQPVAVAVNPVTNMIYVANNSSGNVSVIDGGQDTLVGLPISVGAANPADVVVNPVTNKIYVANLPGNGPDSVTVIDGNHGNTTTLITPPNNDIYFPPPGVQALAVNSTTNTVYFANCAGDAVVAIDGASNNITSAGSSTQSLAVAVNPVTNKTYALNCNNPGMYVVDGATYQTAAVTTGSNPAAVAVNPWMNTAYVANSNDGTVTVVDSNNNPTTVMVGTNPQSVAVNPVTSQVYVANYGSANVTVIDATNNNNNPTDVSVGTNPISVAVNPVTNLVYVANYGSNSTNNNTVTVIDPAHNNNTTTVTVGTNPISVAVNPVTNKIYVANYTSNNVTVIDGATNETTTVTSVGIGPQAVAVNPATNMIYVTNVSSAPYGYSSVTVIDGVNNAASVMDVSAGPPYSIAVNAVSNKIYLAGQAGGKVIDGATGNVTAVSSGPTYNVAVDPATNKTYWSGTSGVFVLGVLAPQGNTLGWTIATNNVACFAMAANPITHRIYTANKNNSSITVIDGEQVQSETVPLTTVITSDLAENQTRNPTPTFTFKVTDAFVPNPTIPYAEFFQVDTWQNAWSPTQGTNPTFAGTLASLQPGLHTLYAYAVDGQDSTSTQPGSPLIGAIQAYQFLVLPLMSQTLSLKLIGPQLVGATVTLTGTASSGLPVIFSSTTPNVCTVSGTTANFIAVGICMITASQPGDGVTYAPATPVIQNINVSIGTQTITFPQPANAALGSGPVTLNATATSGLPVSYSSNSTAVCTVSGSSVTLVSSGTCSITASQAGNANYSSAAPVTQTFSVLTGQTIIFPQPPNTTVNAGPVTLNATASSSLPVSYSSNSMTVCTVAGSSVTLVSAGTCSITATQAGNAIYAAAAPVTQTFTVLNTQTISFPQPANVALGSGPVTLNATASSGLPVSYGSNSTAVCTVSGSSVTLVSAGACSITASQTGNSTYIAATPVTRTFTVLKTQMITFPQPANTILGSGPVTLNATASSGLPVSYTSNSTPVCTVSGASVTLVSGGTCSITASQAGNATYAAAAPVTQTFPVLQTQTITFPQPPNSTLGSGTVTLNATASSGLPVSYTGNTPAVCNVAGSSVTLVSGGTCSITANQAGNAIYAAAPAVTQSFMVTGALLTQKITFGAIATQMVGEPLTLTATASSGLPVSYSSSTTTICTVSGNTATFLIEGICKITASQAGNGTYAAAIPVSRSFSVSPPYANWTLQQINAGGRTTGPASVGPPFVSVYNNQEHVGYRDVQGAIWDSWWDPSSSTWKLQEISDDGKTSGPAAISGPFIGVFSNQQHFAYIDGSGNIWDSYYAGSWFLQKLNNGGKTSGPPALSSAGSFDVSVWTWQGSQQHFSYLSEGGVIYDAYYFSVTGKWYLQQINAGGKTNGPPSVSPPFAFVFQDQQHFVYQDAEGQIWDSYYDAASTNWTLQKINNGGMTNAPLAASGGQPFVWVDPSGKQQHYTYRGVDSAVYDIYYGSSNQWTLQKVTNGGLTEGPAAVNSPFACNFNQQEHIAWRDAGDNIWDAWYDGSTGWNLQKINGPTAGKTTGPAATKGPFVWVYTGTQQHYTYVDTSGTIWDSYWN